jgi:hypothetical protein
MWAREITDRFWLTVVFRQATSWWMWTRYELCKVKGESETVNLHSKDKIHLQNSDHAIQWPIIKLSQF